MGILDQESSDLSVIGGSSLEGIGRLSLGTDRPWWGLITLMGADPPSQGLIVPFKG